MTALLALVAFFLAFAGTAFAAETVTDGGSLLDLVKPVFDAVMSGRYVHAAAAGVILLVAVARRAKLPFLEKDWGGTLAALLVSFAGAVTTATGAGESVTWAVLSKALMVGVTAAGGYTAIRRLLVKPLLFPLMEKFTSKGGLWGYLAVGMQLLLWVFDRPDPEQEAKESGNAAVAKNPPSGVKGVVGDPRDVP